MSSYLTFRDHASYDITASRTGRYYTHTHLTYMSARRHWLTTRSDHPLHNYYNIWFAHLESTTEIMFQVISFCFKMVFIYTYVEVMLLDCFTMYWQVIERLESWPVLWRRCMIYFTLLFQIQLHLCRRKSPNLVDQDQVFLQVHNWFNCLHYRAKWNNE